MLRRKIDIPGQGQHSPSWLFEFDIDNIARPGGANRETLRAFAQLVVDILRGREPEMLPFRIFLAFGSDVGGAGFPFAIKDLRNETRVERIALAFRSAEVINELASNVADVGARPRFVEREVVNRAVRGELDGLCGRGNLSVRSSRRGQ